jgi:hypothetical protein
VDPIRTRQSPAASDRTVTAPVATLTRRERVVAMYRRLVRYPIAITATATAVATQRSRPDPLGGRSRVDESHEAHGAQHDGRKHADGQAHARAARAEERRLARGQPAGAVLGEVRRLEPERPAERPVPVAARHPSSAGRRRRASARGHASV